jgi:Predicted aminoglycoside phosphotransferase
MDMPAAEVDIDAPLVVRLIEAQHPDLLAPLALFENGWDNVIYRLGDSLAVRLPRRQAAAVLVENEQRWLPSIAARIEVPIPAPVRVGRPSPDYPWSWSIVPWFEGVAASEVPVERRSAVAVELGTAVAELHEPAPASGGVLDADVPRNPVRSVPLATRTGAVLERLATGVVANADALRSLWLELVAAPLWAGPPLWLHGDIHPANVLLTDAARPRLAALLDFGDITAGDPATDLAAGWTFFDADARAVFRARYEQLRPVDAATWQRARGWALSMGTAMAAHSDDNPRMAALGVHVLDQVLLDR